MSDSVPKLYTAGTHRAATPESTLERISPYLRACGVTRCADVTGLDSLGIPTYCAVRPRGRLLQVTNGKGLRSVDAKVSALMEAIELRCAEEPAVAFRHASMADLWSEGVPVSPPATLDRFRDGDYFDERRIVAWTRGVDLLTARDVWLPASAVYSIQPSLYDWTTNGLASGNHIVEATLHALYEIIERDTLSRLVVGGDLHFDRCDVVSLDRADDNTLIQLRSRIDNAGLRLVLLRPACALSVHTFMAILLDPDPFSLASAVNVGYGAHLSASVAAARAITEAAQSRLTFIHGAREDLTPRAYSSDDGVHSRLRSFFSQFSTTTDWSRFSPLVTTDLATDYWTVLDVLRAAGNTGIYRAELTPPSLDISVVKVFVAGAQSSFPV